MTVFCVLRPFVGYGLTCGGNARPLLVIPILDRFDCTYAASAPW
ncbi:MAG TPA: hypothetical protein PLM48_08440 [Clostridia bacterium]|nr:hypothetical protein [Clostridia bacterium]